jgi:hypothetical protein
VEFFPKPKGVFMKKILVAAMVLFLTVGFVVVKNQSAKAENTKKEIATQTQKVNLTAITETEIIPLSKKCSFNSDCKYGKCKGNKCGSCSFKSDCKGWGVCKSNKCGGCSFKSDCKGFGDCKSGRCTKSPY